MSFVPLIENCGKTQNPGESREAWPQLSVTEATITRLQNFNKDYDWTICIFLSNCFDVIDLIIVLDSLQTCFDCNLNNNL